MCPTLSFEEANAPIHLFFTPLIARKQLQEGWCEEKVNRWVTLLFPLTNPHHLSVNSGNSLALALASGDCILGNHMPGCRSLSTSYFIFVVLIDRSIGILVLSFMR